MDNSGKETGRGSIYTFFRNVNILLFAAVFCIMAAVMYAAFDGVAEKMSAEYAGRYIVSSAEALSARIVQEIRLMSKAARSDSVIEWMADEGNRIKKSLAYKELSGVVGELYSVNLYAALESSLNEYTVESGGIPADIMPFDRLDEKNPMDRWYFRTARSDDNYTLSIDMDNLLRRKRVWLDYKVVRYDTVLGVLSTGLEFSHIVGELFSQYDSIGMRGLILDENGVILMDSSRAETYDSSVENGNFTSSADVEFSDPTQLAAIQSYLRGNYSGTAGGPAPGKPAVFGLSGRYGWMTAMPVKGTNWSVIILSGTPPFSGVSVFLPVAYAALFLLLAFAVVSAAISYRLIFMPLGRLNRSLAALKEKRGAVIYGVDRNDEIGELASTVHDLFTKANVDALTGINNRRFMEENLSRLIKSLSRSGGVLSVIMIDVDFFKKYNDTYGHEQGDVCLRSIAGTIAAAVKRADDFAARYGGEEFVAVLPNADEAGACLAAERILEDVRALNIPHANNAAAPCVTVSAGVTTGRVERGQTWEIFLKRSDEALYMSKQNGRNKYTFLDLQK